MRTPTRQESNTRLRPCATRWRGLTVCLQIVDGDAMDQLREIVNRVTVLELMVSGKFV